jgi:TatD DNase family protein
LRASLFDTHCHLDDEQFEGQREAIVARAVEAGVETMLAAGTSAQSSQVVCELAGRMSPVLAAVGIHPNHCRQATGADWDLIETLTRQPDVVALGETGLDLYWDYAPLEMQQDFFDRHLRLSQETELPFIVHMRQCEHEVMSMLREARKRGPLRGVMHSFTGSREMAKECLELGFYLSFAGMVTYKKSHELRGVAAVVPDDRLLVETDAPYLSPQPVRGRRPNEPAWVVHTARCLAEVRGVAFEQLAEQTTANARRLFQIA